MVGIKTEIELLRDGDLSGFLHFYSRLTSNYPESKSSKGDLILYAACELAATDYSDQDISLIYLLENKIFEDSEFSGYFLSDFSALLRDGAAILKDALGVAQYLKQHHIDIPVNSEKRPDLNALSLLLADKKNDMLTLQISIDQQARTPQFESQAQLAETSLTNYIDVPEWKTELFFHLREYRIYLESKLNTEPENQKKITFINQILDTKNEVSSRDIQRFIKLQQPTDTVRQTLKQKIIKILTYILNQDLYKQHDAFMIHRAAWQSKGAAKPSADAAFENKENTQPNIQKKG
ncbi:MAG: hypothetical protein WCR08_00235 [Gammaproteobacteria bacterium]